MALWRPIDTTIWEVSGALSNVLITMTVGHLVLAGALTLYTLIGIQLEERDLARIHGEPYKSYERQVSMVIPSLPRKQAWGRSHSCRTKGSLSCKQRL
jgi:hypothetical protein